MATCNLSEINVRSAVLVDVRLFLTFVIDRFVLARAELNVEGDTPVDAMVIVSVDGLPASVIPEPATRVSVSVLLSATTVLAPILMVLNESDAEPPPPAEDMIIESVVGSAARVIFAPATRVSVSVLLSATTLLAPTVIVLNESDADPPPPEEAIVIVSVVGLAARIIFAPATNVRVSPLLSAKMLFAPTVILENVFVEYLASALAT